MGVAGAAHDVRLGQAKYRHAKATQTTARIRLALNWLLLTDEVRTKPSRVGGIGRFPAASSSGGGPVWHSLCLWSQPREDSKRRESS
jgi:hypothetical protein